MANLVIPVVLEKNLALQDGSTGGCPISKALQFDQSEVFNLYSITSTGIGGELRFSFQEHGVAYNETSASDCLVKATVQLEGAVGAAIGLTVDPTPVQMWGINFAGRVLVKHEAEGTRGGEEKVIYLPGTRTYDPAGITGDPHASERIGPSCSRTQIGITIAELVVAHRGAPLDQLRSMHEKIRTIVRRYHGREVLFDWMRLQIEEAVYNQTDVSPYPEYIKGLVRSGRFELQDSRKHTREYLVSYNSGLARPPVHYYRKVAKKDNVGEILSAEDLVTFKKIIE